MDGLAVKDQSILKGIVHTKLKTGTDLDKFIDGSSAMGAVRMRVQTADKNITIIHK